MSLDWNYNGSLYGVTNKEKMIHIADPRGNKIVMSTKGHDSTKSQRMGFLGNTDYLFSCGFNKSNERQIKLYDSRNIEEAVMTVPVDTQTGVMMPYYDTDTGLIYVPGRGEGNIKYFDFSNGTVKYANEFRSGVPQKAIAAFPKRSVNYNKCEITKFAKLTLNTIEYVSFFVPKRVFYLFIFQNEGYDASFYPDCFAGEAALGVEEWLKGENTDPIRKPITSLENNFSTSDLNFSAKEEEKNGSPRSDEKIKLLQEKVNELERNLESSNNYVNNYEAKIGDLTNENAELKNVNNDLNAKISELENELNNLKTQSEENK